MNFSEIKIFYFAELTICCKLIFKIISFLKECTVAAINLETPRFFYCKLFVTLTMLLTYQFRLRQSVECAQR
jgi:hypothetical protein